MLNSLYLCYMSDNVTGPEILLSHRRRYILYYLEDSLCVFSELEIRRNQIAISGEF